MSQTLAVSRHTTLGDLVHDFWRIANVVDSSIDARSPLTDLLAEFARLDELKRLLKEYEEANKRALDLVEKLILDQVAEGKAQGNIFQGIKINGRSIYISRDRWPKAVQGNDLLISALKANKLGQYVHESFNTQSLRGYTNELIRNYEENYDNAPPEKRPEVFDINDAIPEELRPYLEVTETFHVKSRKT